MYREDEEAARARADALQVDLDRTEAELAETKDRLAVAEAVLEAAKLPVPPRTPFAELPPVPHISDRWDQVFVAVIVVLMAWVAIYAITR